jgi:two-component system phosphate regulon response regulator PhoB
MTHLDTKESQKGVPPTVIAIIEDDRDLNNLLKYTIESSGRMAVSCYEGTSAIAFLETNLPDLILLDLSLPDCDGTDLLRTIRSREKIAAAPIIVLTARTGESDKLSCFGAGADDYIAKPFSPRELLLRIESILKRSGVAPAPVTPLGRDITIGRIRIVPEDLRVYVDSVAVQLTNTEFQLITFLAERLGRVQSRETLLQKVWGYEGKVNTRTVDTHVKRLRQKLGSAGDQLDTVHGFGYQLVATPPN